MLKLEPEKINALLGTDIAAEEMVSILKKLDFQVEGDQVTVPSWRGDVEAMADLAEEVARFHGYNNIPITLMRGQTTLGGYSPEQQLERALGGGVPRHAAMTRSSPTPSSPPPTTTRSAGLRTIPAASPSRSSTPWGRIPPSCAPPCCPPCWRS